MSVFKCKMCGGTIEFEEGATVGVCDSCGTKQTLPRLDSDRKANLYDRANHFRRNNDFDKAMSIYEQILNEDNTDSEAYWSLVLCRYGIEYVEDPSSHKRIPTVNRTQYTSILADEDYKAALRYADGYQRSIYEEEARTIDDIQKGILEISTKEEPFDVFISFKETDANGRRTPDAVLANDLYHQLTQEGFKVFYAPITLEDKLGTAYEPYIFAALNSAKVMVVLGTKPENFNAVWVKNEWSRFLALIKNGAKKTLIPAYKDMDPYDLPEEFSHLMAQDMSKLGFMQDLIRGIRKIVNADTPKTTVKETVVVNTGNNNISPLLERAFLFLEDGEWQKADDFCEQVLNQDPRNARAYLGKLMIEMKVRKAENLRDCELPFDGSNNFQKIVRFGDPDLIGKLKSDIEYIKTRNELARKKSIYAQADESAKNAKRAKDWNSAAELFQSISDFEDADRRAEECRIKAEECRKNEVYDSARALMIGEKTDDYESAIKVFRTIYGWKDSEQQIYECQKKIEEIRQNEEKARIEAERKAEERRIAAEKAKQKTKKVLSVAIPAVILALIAIIIISIKAGQYVENTDNSASTESETLFNYNALYRSHEPEETVMTVNGEDISWDEYFQNLSQCMQEAKNNGMTDLSAAVSEGEDTTWDEYIRLNAEEYVKNMHAVTGYCSENGIELTDEIRQSIDETLVAYTASVCGDGATEEDLAKYLKEQKYVTLDTFKKLVEAQYLVQNILTLAYGENCEKITDEQAISYLEENGLPLDPDAVIAGSSNATGRMMCASKEISDRIQEIFDNSEVKYSEEFRDFKISDIV